MLFSYLKIAVRNLYKNKSYSLINILGLGVAMAMCVVGYVNYQFSQSYDSFHKNVDSIYLICSYNMNNNSRQNWSYSPMPMAPAVAKEVPGVDKFCRVSYADVNVRYENKVFRETICYADNDFFNMFTFPIIKGRDNPLQLKNGIVINEEIAQKYFGNDDPIGKHLILSRNGRIEYDFIVQSVISTPPKNSSLLATMIIPYENLERIGEFDLLDWENWCRAGFIMCENKAAMDDIERNLQAYVQKTKESNPEFPLDGFYLVPLKGLASVSRDLYGNPFFPGMHPAAIVAPSIIAFLVLLLACFNFINTAIAFAAKRLKEIGIRKVIGGLRGQLIRQFLGENIVLCLIALLVAAFLAEIFVPAYDSLWPEISLSINYFESFKFVGFLIALLLFTAIASGAYPAFYVSKFKPAEILKGKQKLGGTNPLIRVLLTFQMALSIAAVIAAAILSQNASYINNLDHGFDKDNVYLVPIGEEQEYSLLKDALMDHPGLVRSGVTQSLMGRYIMYVYAEIEQEREVIGFYRIAEGFFETVGHKLIAGRNFDQNLTSDREESVLVNEKFVRAHGWDNAIGKSFKIQLGDSEKEYTIIGVVKDFYPNGINTELSPAAMIWASPEQYRYFAIKCDSDDPGEFAAYVQKTWKRLFPHLPFNGFWLDDNFGEERQVNNSIRLVFLYIAVMVIIITSMGLYALVSLNVSRRTKEIGIRKVLGASVSNIGMLISREFIILLCIGSVLASVLGYFLVNSLLHSIWFYYVDFDLMPFLISIFLVFIITSLTMGLKVVSAANTNPVETLRYE